MPEGARAESAGARYGGRASMVHDTLQREILTLAIAPGAALDETQIAQRFGTSRSPVREALSRLAAEGLVVTLSNRASVAAPLALADFPGYVEALILLQRACTRLAATRRTDADLAAMRAAARAFDDTLGPHDYLAMSAANKTFHMTVAAAARNPYLEAQYARLLDEGRRLLHMQFRHLEQAENPNPLAEDHHLMIAAIGARDAERADALARRHAEGFQRRLLDFLATAETARLPLADGTESPGTGAKQPPARGAQDASGQDAPTQQER